MIISRTPLRISIAGGGTDIPAYYQRYGSWLITGAIDRYIYVSVNRSFDSGYKLKYSKYEHVADMDDIEHPIFRELLRSMKVPPGVEITSTSDIPAGTGLGSSGSFAVGLILALNHHMRRPVTPAEIAEEACRIEIEVLKRPSGKQDQYAAALGGLIEMDITRTGEVSARPLLVSDDTLHDLEDNLLLFFTGYSRRADQELSVQKQGVEQGDAAMVDNLTFVQELGRRIREHLLEGDCSGFGACMHEHWEMKRKRTTSMSNARIDRLYKIALDNGAIGGKLVGAGGGGFLMFYAKDKVLLKAAMRDEGVIEERFRFCMEGASLITVNR